MGSLKEIRRKIELFFRGEFYLHLATMFLIQTILLKIFYNFTFLLLIPIILGILKEVFDKKEGKDASISDILGTVLGGYLAMLIYYYGR